MHARKPHTEPTSAPAADEPDEPGEPDGPDERLQAVPVATPPHVPPAVVPELLSLATILATPLHQPVSGCALILRCEAATDRAGHPFLTLTVRGADGGRVEARWWRYPHAMDRRPAVGQVCWLRGDLDSYNGERQIRLQELRPLPEVPPDRFARATRRSGDALRADLATVIGGLEQSVAALVHTVLSGDVYERFCIWPAAQHAHGAVRHGLLAHSLRVAQLARSLAAAYEPDGLRYDADLVTAASLLHDVGKVYTLPAVAGAAIPDEAGQCDHVTRGVLMVQAAAATLEPEIPPPCLDGLTHAILAHHGRKEWGAAVEPLTVEAWLVHLADLAESRLWDWADQEQP
jgi:3'-5' exoribonuclease